MMDEEKSGNQLPFNFPSKSQTTFGVKTCKECGVEASKIPISTRTGVCRRCSFNPTTATLHNRAKDKRIQDNFARQAQQREEMLNHRRGLNVLKKLAMPSVKQFSTPAEVQLQNNIMNHLNTQIDSNNQAPSQDVYRLCSIAFDDFGSGTTERSTPPVGIADGSGFKMSYQQ
jgi:hypothetical protein